MGMQLAHLHFPSFLLIGITYLLSYRDRAFSAQIRARYHLVMPIALMVTCLDIIVDMGTVPGSLAGVFFTTACNALFCPLILLVWMSLIIREKNKGVYRGLMALLVIEVILWLTSFRTGFYFYQEGPEWRIAIGSLVSAVYCLFILLTMLYFTGKEYGSYDELEHFVIAIVTGMSLLAVIAEYGFGCVHTLDGILTIGICVYYYYSGLQLYKRDALTKLMNRHNFNYDMEEMQERTFCLSIIDIDNFKMINDKYGHNKGDEALVTVVRTIRNRLLRHCRMYRYGGDEFAIISRDVSPEKLSEMFEQINEDLDAYGYRISYGTTEHTPKDTVEETVERADTAMYEKKRLLKSEDIWDDMTGLYNLRGFLDELESLKKIAQKEGRNITLVSLDVERLGNINMAYGYLEGNMVITSIAGIIKSSFDMQEFAGHLGSDEFIIAFMTQPEDESYTEAFIDKILIGVKNSQNFDGKEYTIDLNIATYVIEVGSEMPLEECVNQAMNQKQSEKEGRRKAGFAYDQFDDLDFDSAEEALALDIIENNKLRYALQPIVSAKDGNIVAYEALMRSDTEPALSPLSVLRYAAKNKKNYEIEMLTFSNVLHRIATDDTIPKDAKVFMNSLPGFTLLDEDYDKLKAKYPGVFDRLVIEITEQSELDDEALTTIKERQERDCFKIAIDDFGSGNSNTYSLLRYQPDYIKLDRLLITDIDRNTKKQYFVNSIITFAKENGMAVIAEGVETVAELKMMIRLQVDYIQGYYTAKPAFEPLAEIDSEIKQDIVTENIRGVIEGKRKIFLASGGWEFSLVQLALDEYTGITVSSENIKIVGNTDYVADMCIKIKEGLNCRMTLQDVRLNSVDELPCIEVGEGATLTLMIEGNCSMNYKGIRVPEGSTLIVKGSGNLEISTKGHYCYCIGGGKDETIGSIILNQSGKLSVRVDGDQCVAIGGDFYKAGDGIRVDSGELEVYVAGVEGIGFGCFNGDMPIRLRDCLIHSEYRVNTGSFIGVVNGRQDIELKSFNISVQGSGSKLSVIGTNHEFGGKILLDSGALHVICSGQEINIIGTKSGDLRVDILHMKLELKGEGDRVMAIGTNDKQAVIDVEECIVDIIINSSIPLAYGAEEENIKIYSVAQMLKINE